MNQQSTNNEATSNDAINDVVILTEITPEIVQIKMQDKKNKNTFSYELSVGLLTAFDQIAKNKSYKVVILTGYGPYFCSGGTQQGLTNLHQGEGTFADVNLYSLAMDCEIPVISAMQGHGIGGGFVMGLYSDFVVLCYEAVYTTNFMKYGFTPGMGATYILNKKLGTSLASEMLISANTFRGATLKERGVPYAVLPREELMDYVYELAQSVAEKPRKALVTLKKHLVKTMREELPSVIAEEVAMHDETFHGQEVIDNITTKFGK